MALKNRRDKYSKDALLSRSLTTYTFRCTASEMLELGEFKIERQVQAWVVGDHKNDEAHLAQVEVLLESFRWMESNNLGHQIDPCNQQYCLN